MQNRSLVDIRALSCADSKEVVLTPEQEKAYLDRILPRLRALCPTSSPFHARSPTATTFQFSSHQKAAALSSAIAALR